MNRPSCLVPTSLRYVLFLVAILATIYFAALRQLKFARVVASGKRAGRVVMYVEKTSAEKGESNRRRSNASSRTGDAVHPRSHLVLEPPSSNGTIPADDIQVSEVHPFPRANVSEPAKGALPPQLEPFTSQTALNYFHLHKTGGVSVKERLFDFFFQKGKRNAHGEKARILDTCHMSSPARTELGTEAAWSCDWAVLQNMSETDRNRIDVIVGHQYWERGASYWLPNRDMRYFTVMRHPLHRKISFFYHFFVRNVGREEHHVTTQELISFVLGRVMPDSPLIRDAGPGYYASRLWSDGVSGYSRRNMFEIAEEKVDQLVNSSIDRLRHNFVFIGLQTQERASLCMLKEVVHDFAKAHGFANMSGLQTLATPRERLNTGSYGLTGAILWQRMTPAEREEFKRVERVDLAIYRESVKMFGEMVRRFGCDRFVERRDEDDIAL